MKTALREDWNGASYKTVQRYFRGERVAPETVEAILDALVNTLVPTSLALQCGLEVGPLSLHELVRQGLRYYAWFWDAFVTEVNSHSYPVHERRDLPIPILRLVVLDLGIRWGAGWGLHTLEGKTPDWNAVWWSEKALGALIDQLRQQKGLTVAALAEGIETSVQAVEEWRAGRSLPTSNHIEALSANLAGSPEYRQSAEYLMRLVVGLMAIRKELFALCGQERIQDMLAAMSLTARHVHDLLFRSSHLSCLFSNFDELQAGLWKLMLHGARCPIGFVVAEQLAALSAFNQEVATDFLALSGNWIARARYWMEWLGAAPKRAAFTGHRFAQLGRTSEREGEEIAHAVHTGTLRMTNFDWRPEPGSPVVRLSPPPEMKAGNRMLQAERAMSIERYDAAIEHLRRAVKHQPLDAVMHFKLGAVLGIAANRGQPDLFEEALLECRLAVQIDPDFDNARNEIGIILSNARRHEEAEQAFAEAEPYYQHHAHHWFVRGTNYLALRRHEEARTAFERAIERKGGVHVRAMEKLAATLMALGRTSEARRWGKKVEHLTGRDPTDEWQQVLKVW